MARRYFTTAEAAEYLQEMGAPGTRKSLETWRCRGVGPAFVRIRGCVRYLLADLEQFAAGAHTRTADQPAGRP